MERFATWVTYWAGTNKAFVSACSIILIWLVTGPVFNYSDTWQLIINTGTTIITFLMVFLIQRTANKETHAINIKLNELILKSNASNKLINIEELTEKQIEEIALKYKQLKNE